MRERHLRLYLLFMRHLCLPFLPRCHHFSSKVLPLPLLPSLLVLSSLPRRYLTTPSSSLPATSPCRRRYLPAPSPPTLPHMSSDPPSMAMTSMEGTDVRMAVLCNMAVVRKEEEAVRRKRGLGRIGCGAVNLRRRCDVGRMSSTLPLPCALSLPPLPSPAPPLLLQGTIASSPP